MRVNFRLIDKRTVGDGIVKRKHLIQMRLGCRKLADEHQISTKGIVTQNKRGRSVALIAQTQQVLSHALCQIEFAAEHVTARMPIRHPKELWRRIQLLPQLSCTNISPARFRRGEAFDHRERRAQGAAKFELLALALWAVRQ